MVEDAAVLVEQLGKLSQLKILDISANPRLWLLSVGMLNIAVKLESFKCDGCSLVLPPPNFFSTPEQNPNRIQELLRRRSSVDVLKLSAVNLTPHTASQVAALLQCYPALKRLDVSGNPALSCAGAAAIFSALSGMLSAGALFARHISSNC
jgi:hypothetical protein